jgi:predicted metalloprotease
MRLGNSRTSRNVEDRRGRRTTLGGKGSIGIGTIILALVAIYFGVDPSVVLQDGATPASRSASYDTSPGEASQTPEVLFVSRVLGDTEDTWHALFRELGAGNYQEPRLVLYEGATRSACGLGQSAMGPFYCPGDAAIYLDLSFFGQLERDLDSPGDFAQAYVIAHEVAHHVQNQLGVMDRVARARATQSATQANAVSVRVELQADCYAGVWAHHSDAQRGTLEAGDIEEGLNAAAAIGDDRLQRRSQGHVVPDSFTHGSSAQRVRWFTRGYESGDPRQCDTFSAARL